MAEETYSPDQLIAGDFPIITDTGTILSGENLSRGAVLGIVTASGKYRLCDADTPATDGSQDPKAILVEDVDASGGDVTDAPIYLAGEFNENKLTMKASTTIAQIKAALRALSIFIKSARAASV